MNLELGKKGWTKVKLDDVVEWYQRDIPNDKQEQEGVRHYITSDHIGSDEIKIKRYGELKDGQKGPTITKHFEKGDILLSTRSTALHKAGIAPVDGVTGEKLLVLRVKKGSKLIKELFPFVIHTNRFWNYAINSAAGSVNKFTSWTKLREYEFLLPLKEQQAKLAELLWAGYSFSMCSEELAKSLSSFKENLLRVLFEKYDRNTSIEDIALVTSGGTPNRRTPNYWNGTIPWIKTGEIEYEDIYSAEETITEEGMKNSSAKLIPKGSILMAMYGEGVTRGRVARLMIDATLNQACAAIIPRTNSSLTRDYIFYCLQYLYDEIREMAQGATQQNLNGKLVKSIKIPYPDEAVQKKVVEQMKKVENAKRDARDSALNTSFLIRNIISQIFN